MAQISYAELLNCKTAAEVRQRVREWGSTLSDDEHLIRSAILDLHANLELRLKQIVFHQFVPLLGHFTSEAEAETHKRILDKNVRKLSFNALRNLLQPAFKSYGPSDIDHVWEIDALRNQVAHGHLGDVAYRGRNPFHDHDSLAQVYFDYWTASKELGKFFDRRIDGPKLIAEEHEEGCSRHYDCKNGLR